VGIGALRETELGFFVAAISLPHILGDTVAGLLPILTGRKEAAKVVAGIYGGRPRGGIERTVVPQISVLQ
jgi:hypothetical protein